LSLTTHDTRYAPHYTKQSFKESGSPVTFMGMAIWRTSMTTAIQWRRSVKIRLKGCRMTAFIYLAVMTVSVWVRCRTTHIMATSLRFPLMLLWLWHIMTNWCISIWIRHHWITRKCRNSKWGSSFFRCRIQLTWHWTLTIAVTSVLHSIMQMFWNMCSMKACQSLKKYDFERASAGNHQMQLTVMKTKVRAEWLEVKDL